MADDSGLVPEEGLREGIWGVPCGAEQRGVMGGKGKACFASETPVGKAGWMRCARETRVGSVPAFSLTGLCRVEQAAPGTPSQEPCTG